MLFKIDNFLNRAPSRIINFLTFGPKGSSLCARAYLYVRYIDNHAYFAKKFIALCNVFEPQHCYLAARYWRARVCADRNLSYPVAYVAYLQLPNTPSDLRRGDIYAIRFTGTRLIYKGPIKVNSEWCYQFALRGDISQRVQFTFTEGDLAQRVVRVPRNHLPRKYR